MSDPLTQARKALLGKFPEDLKSLAQDLTRANSLLVAPPSSRPSTFPSALGALSPLFASTFAPLLIQLPGPTLTFYFLALSIVQKELVDVCLVAGGQADGGGQRWRKGRELLGEGWESVAEGVLIGLKMFLKDRDDRGRPVVDADKHLIGEHFTVLASFLSVAGLRVMLKRRILDVFEYACESADWNRKRLALQTVLGPSALAGLIFDAADHGLSERALELAFTIGQAIVKMQHVSGANQKLKAQWDEHVVPSKSYGNSRMAFFDLYRKMKATSYEDDASALLAMLSARNPSNFQLIHALTLSANSHALVNAGGITSQSKGVTFGCDVSFNRHSFTAITTHAIPSSAPHTEDEEDDVVQAVLEVEFSHVDRIVVAPPEVKGGPREVKIVLFRPPLMDSAVLGRREACDLFEDEIVFKVRAEDVARLQKVLNSRKLSSEFVDPSPDLDSKAPAKKNARESISPVSSLASDSHSPLATTPPKPKFKPDPLPPPPAKKSAAPAAKAKPASKPAPPPPRTKPARRAPKPRGTDDPPPPPHVPVAKKKKTVARRSADAFAEVLEAPELPAKVVPARRAAANGKAVEVAAKGKAGDAEDNGDEVVVTKKGIDGKGKGKTAEKGGGGVDVLEGGKEQGASASRRKKVALEEEAKPAPRKRGMQSKPVVLAPDSDAVDPHIPTPRKSRRFEKEVAPVKEDSPFSFTFGVEDDGDFAMGEASDESEEGDPIDVFEKRLARMSKGERKNFTSLIQSQIGMEVDGEAQEDEMDVDVVVKSPQVEIVVKPQLMAPVFVIPSPCPPPVVAKPSPVLPKPTSHRSHRPKKSKERSSGENSGLKSPGLVASPRSPPVKAIDTEDADLAAVLQEVSDAILLQYSERKRETRQSFDETCAALDALARKLTGEFISGTEKLLQDFDRAFDWSAAEAKVRKALEECDVFVP